MPHDRSAHNLGDARVDPAGRDQLLQHAHVTRSDVVIEIVARPIPLLGQLERRIARQRILAIEKLCVQVFE